jgi:hypothetical protein
MRDDSLTPEMRDYLAYWAARQPRRTKLTALGLTLVPCETCDTVQPFVKCSACWIADRYRLT